MKNQVIKVLNREHGKKVIEYWKSKDVDTKGYEGTSTAEEGNSDCYYGVINNNFVLYTFEEVKQVNAQIIELPAEEPILTYPRVMEVSDERDFSKVSIRVVIAHKCGKYIAWNDAETLEDAENSTGVCPWRYAREITPPKPEPVHKPFDRVLVRSSTTEVWEGQIYGYRSAKGHICMGGYCYQYCIPYEGNEELLGQISLPNTKE